jgi:hypothetical protein
MAREMWNEEGREQARGMGSHYSRQRGRTMKMKAQGMMKEEEEEVQTVRWRVDGLVFSPQSRRG